MSKPISIQQWEKAYNELLEKYRCLKCTANTLQEQLNALTTSTTTTTTTSP